MLGRGALVAFVCLGLGCAGEAPAVTPQSGSSPSSSPVVEVSPPAPAPSAGPSEPAGPEPVAEAPTAEPKPDDSGTAAATSKPGSCGCAPGDLMCALNCQKKKEKQAWEPIATPPPPSPPGSEFDRGAASQALSDAASKAKSCKQANGPTGAGKVLVVYGPSGRVTSATIDTPPYAGTPVGGCIAALFRNASIPAYNGNAVTVSKSFSIQ